MQSVSHLQLKSFIKQNVQWELNQQTNRTEQILPAFVTWLFCSSQSRMNKMDEASLPTQSKPREEKFGWGLAYSPQGIIRLLNILEQKRASSAFFPFLPFLPYPPCNSGNLPKEILTETGKCLRNFLNKQFPEKYEKLLTIFNCEMYWLFFSSNSCLKMTYFCYF